MRPAQSLSCVTVQVFPLRQTLNLTRQAFLPHSPGLQPGASQEAIAAAFRVTILRCHPDLHGNAPWAIAKTQRTLKAAEMLRGSRSGAGPDTTWTRTPGSRRGGGAPGPFLRRGPNVSFYPNTAFDYWAAYGARPPTPEEAQRFKEDWEAAKAVAAERLRKQQAARSGSGIPPDLGTQAMPFAAAGLVVALIFAQARALPLHSWWRQYDYCISSRGRARLSKRPEAQGLSVM